MIFGMFSNPKPPPLTTVCMKLTAPENMLKFAEVEMPAAEDPDELIDQRAQILCSIIMASAGRFIGDLQEGWEGSRRYLRNTNLDVITAEAMIWIDFLIGTFINDECKEDPYRFGDLINSWALQLILGTMRQFTGFDFKAAKYHAERRGYYLEEMKNDGMSFEPFATIVLRSVGRQSFTDPLQNIGPLPPPEWTPLSLIVATFFSTVPSSFEKFKNLADEWSDRNKKELAGFIERHRQSGS
jgi:hypothetical protein